MMKECLFISNAVCWCGYLKIYHLWFVIWFRCYMSDFGELAYVVLCFKVLTIRFTSTICNTIDCLE